MLLVGGLTAVLGGVGCGSSARVDTIQGLTGTVSSGQTVYETHCKSCHGATGTQMANAAGEAKSNPAEALEVILNGEDSMPAFDSLSDQELADLLTYLKTL
jgi:mono/diheme cytochrome c family protein